MNRKNIPAPIVAERKRQITAEGWTAAHDDEHTDGDMRIVAQAYYWHATGSSALGWQYCPIIRDSKRVEAQMRIPCPWPWAPKWWKPKTPERDLERAGALCIAEIERLERSVEDLQAPDEAVAAKIKEVERLLGGIIKAYNARVQPAKPVKKMLPPMPGGRRRAP